MIVNQLKKKLDNVDTYEDICNILFITAIGSGDHLSESEYVEVQDYATDRLYQLGLIDEETRDEAKKVGREGGEY